MGGYILHIPFTCTLYCNCVVTVWNTHAEEGGVQITPLCYPPSSPGHECPFAIQVHHNRQQMDLAGESRPTQIQFVIKRRSPMPSGKSALKTTARIIVNFIPRPFHHPVFEEYEKTGREGLGDFIMWTISMSTKEWGVQTVLKSFPVVSVQDLEA